MASGRRWIAARWPSGGIYIRNDSARRKIIQHFFGEPGVCRSADEIRRAIVASLAAFSGTVGLQDDLTIVVAQFVSTADYSLKTKIQPDSHSAAR
jgi:hypothetical protein